MKKILFVVLAAVLLMCAAPLAPAEEGNAEELTACVKFAFKRSDVLTDHKKKTCYRFLPNKSYSVYWSRETEVKSMLLEFWDIPGDYTLGFYTQEDALIAEIPGKPAYAVTYPVPEQTQKVRLTAGEETVSACSWEFWSAGEGPAPIEWLPVPDKLDYMVVATHFDDDVLFLGAIVPIYGAGQGRPGTIVYTASHSRERLAEGLDGAYEMGLRNLPLFTRFENSSYVKKGMKFNAEALESYLVKAYRRYEPEIVVTQDLNGEYGHWQHKLTASSAEKAVRLAADESYDPESAEAYGTWQVKKLYVHLYPENKITLDVNVPIEALGGRTALETARDAFQCHASQVKMGHHEVKNTGIYDLTDFGLAFTAVGPDTPGVNDMFENID